MAIAMVRADVGGDNTHFETSGTFAGFGTADFTMASWVFRTSTATGWMGNYFWGDSAAPAAQQIGTVIRSGVSNAWGIWYDGDHEPAATVLGQNQWYHLCITRVGTLISFYLDGVADGTYTHGSTLSFGDAQPMTYGFPALSLIGNTGEMGFWTRALTAGEIAALAAGSPPERFLDGLITYSPLIRDVFGAEHCWISGYGYVNVGDIPGDSAHSMPYVPILVSFPTLLAPVTGQIVVVPAIAATSAIVAPAVDQQTDVPATSATTAIVAPTVDQDVDVPPIAASTSSLAPAVDQAVNVPAIAASSAIVAPTLDQTTDVPAIGASTSIVAPAVDRDVDVPTTAAATAVVAPGRGRSVPSIVATSAIVAPTVDTAQDQSVNVAATAATSAMAAPGRGRSVPAIAATSGIVSPVVETGEVDVPAIAATTAILAPQVDQLIDVPAIGAVASISPPLTSLPPPQANFDLTVRDPDASLTVSDPEASLTVTDPDATITVARADGSITI